MSSQDFVADLLKGFTKAFKPLEEGLKSADAFAVLLADFGWSFGSSADFAALDATLRSVYDSLEKLEQAAASLDSSNPTGEQLANAIQEVVKAIQALVSAIRGLSETNPASMPSPFDNPDFWHTFPMQLLDCLLYRYLQEQAPELFGILLFLGVLSEKFELPSTPGRYPYFQRSVHWDLIPKAIAQPESLLAKVYGWGSDFDDLHFVGNLQRLLQAFGLPVGVYPPSESDLDYYYDTGNPVRQWIAELRAPLYWALIDDGTELGLVELSLVLMPIPPLGSRTDNPVGFIIYPLLTGRSQQSIQITDGVNLELQGGFESKVIKAEIRPDGTRVSASTGDTSLSALAALTAQPASPWTLIGTAKSSRVELAKAHIGLSANGPVDDIEYQIELGADNATLIVDFGESDGFLQKLLGGNPQRFDLSTALLWSNKTGFHFKGQAKLEANLPVHLSIAGIITVDTIHIVLRPGSAANSAVLQAALTGGLRLGPIVAMVDRVGLQAELVALDKTTPPGNLGDINVSFGFKPPSGIGLAVDATVVKGGGYLFFDTDKEQYAGVLQLEIAQTIAIKAIGLLTTRMPDGSKGFSLLVIITAEGFGPIQLGFGFTLTGIGGLLGVNRTVVVDTLRSGIKNGTVGSILFPEDPVRNASRIVSDVGSVFPPAIHRYVFGPMVKINWGTPPILTMEIGLVLEVPDPIRLLILGRLLAVLPEDKDALIRIRMDSLGVIDFGKGEVSLDATLYDSRILTFVLTGDMAMRANFGDNPGFLLAIGGWNPGFPSPAGFPLLSRMALSLSTNDNARLRLESYLAVTSNTVQFGAKADFYFAVPPFSLEGHLGFDALFHFSPFSFIADLSASAVLRMNGSILMSVGLNMTLSGPSPWHVWGTAQFSILGCKQSVSFDSQYGADQQPALPAAVDVSGLLTTALSNVRNWSSELPRGARPLVAFRTSTAVANVLSVHPLAEVAVRERVVPLDMPITKFGNAPVSGDNKFSVKAVRSDDGSEISSVENIRDSFAMAQFVDMSDDEKLSQPAFTSANAGIRFTIGEFTYGYEPALDSAITYETLLILPDQSVPQPQGYVMPATVLDGVVTFGAAAQARRPGVSGVRAA